MWHEINFLQLANGLKIPLIGYGTGVVRKYSRKKLLFIKSNIYPILSSIKHLRISKQLTMDIFAAQIIRNAYSNGFRLFDTGRIYGYSEKMIGKGLNGIDRSSFYLVTKVSDMDIERKCSPDTVRENLSESLRYLGTDHVDAYLLHWPHGDWISIYLEMEKEYKEGRARSIGVCNFNISHFEQLMKKCNILPHICQTELHPFNSKPLLRMFCKEHNIVLMAHTPTARMCEKVRQCKVLLSLSRKYHKTVAQIILRWHMQNGIIPIVATVSGEHMKENLDCGDFTLSQEEMQMIDSLNEDYVMLDSDGVDDPNYIYNL